MNWPTYKFHCSGLANLMVTPRLKGETLSETTKSYLRELWVQETFGRKNPNLIANKAVRKGIVCEMDSIKLLERVTGEKFSKNDKTFENDYIVGTPDIIVDRIIDTKTSLDIWTFADVTEDKARKDYYYQLQGYKWLTGLKKSELAYCLVNMPPEMVADEMYRLSFYMPENEQDNYRNNWEYGDIEDKLKVKRYSFVKDEKAIEVLTGRIVSAREYLAKITL